MVLFVLHNSTLRLLPVSVAPPNTHQPADRVISVERHFLVTSDNFNCAQVATHFLATNKNTNTGQIQRLKSLFGLALFFSATHHKHIQSTTRCISMTSTTILRPPYSATHPWESGDWGSSGFGSSFMQKLSNDRQRGGAVDDSHDMKGDKSGNQSKPAQRSKQQQSPAATGFHSPKKPTMALKGDPDSNAVLKRSFSTPAVRSMARDYNQQPASATGEKKRNKLGYHRTSIACSKLKAFNTARNLAPNKLV